MNRSEGPQTSRRLVVLAVTLLLVLAAAPSAAADGHGTGLERALKAAADAQAQAQARMAEVQENSPDPGETHDDDASTVPPGLQRAHEAVGNALDRKNEHGDNGNHNGQDNGNGHGWGRGHSAEVHAVLLAGGSPSELEPHGQSVSEMVHAYNEMRKQLRDDEPAAPQDD
jgi:hypothetical protein